MQIYQDPVTPMTRMAMNLRPYHIYGQNGYQVMTRAHFGPEWVST